MKNQSKNPRDSKKESNKESNEEIPTFKAVGIMRSEPNKLSSFLAVELTIRGNEVVDVKPGYPNLAPIAIDEAKIAFSKLFLSGSIPG